MIEVMKQALEALEHSHANEPIWKTPHREAITSLRQAIEQAEKQEPVAWVCYGASEKHDIDFQQDDIDALPVGTQLYTTPQPHHKWVGLTDEEIAEGVKQSWVTEQAFQSAAWWAEAKLKEKNT